jgi:EAL domain-containing protein (putative c-di-GMP-specific phosphodiesterase class I)
MRTVAEGIETEVQARALDEMGCEQGQGYYFSRPVTGRQFERLLAAGTVVPANGRQRTRTGGVARARA